MADFLFLSPQVHVAVVAVRATGGLCGHVCEPMSFFIVTITAL